MCNVKCVSGAHLSAKGARECMSPARRRNSGNTL